MPDESLNPYASPTVSKPLAPEPARESYRMSKESLEAAIRLMVASEVTFAVGWLLFIASLFIPFGWRMSELALWAAVASFLVAWIASIGLVIRCRGVGMLLVVLIMPFPLLGSLAFLVCVNHTRETFIVNGYTPKFLGASPDEAERVAMEAEPFYRPSLKFDRQGEKRSLNSALTHFILGIVTLGFIALIGFA